MLTELSGRTIAGRFDLLALLGSGGMGAVYRAHDRELDEVVALKIMRSAYARQPELIARFRNEVKLARKVTHRNVARTYEMGHDGELVYCTMELIAGRSLGALLSQRAPLHQSEAVTISFALCEALEAAHGVGVIHRDIKPDNILLGDDGRVVLADFGIAALHGEALDVAGTPPYMAPEQFNGAPPSPATDVYAVGVILYEMLVGKRAFIGTAAHIRDEKERVPNLTPTGADPEIVRAVERATMRDVARRIGSAAELARLIVPKTARASTAVPEQGTSAIGEQTKTYELRTVIVLTPRGDDKALPIVGGVHEVMLERIAALPRVRVRPRVTMAPEADATLVVSMRAAEDIEVTITRRDGRETVLRAPLAFGEIYGVAAACARAVELALANEPAADQTEALELYLRARQLVRLNATTVDVLIRAQTLLEKAAELQPQDPRILATLASTMSRIGMTPGHLTDETLARVSALVDRAVAIGPDVVDAHLAAAHLTLMTRDAYAAARHFRRALACAPYSGEAHEHLGRMLLEAGFVDLGLARIEEAIAMTPELASPRWDRARAWYLDGRRDEARREADALFAIGSTRILMMVRMAWWDRDMERSAFWRDELARTETTFERALQPKLFAALHDGAWPRLRDQIMSAVCAPMLNRRLTALLCQLVAEVAALAGDRDACVECIEHAIDAGLFDRLWLERCPLLDDVRSSPRYTRVHHIVIDRAELILDALYGDGVKPDAEPTVVI